MRRIWLITLALVTMVAWVIGCSDDIVLESESDITGNYEGIYTVTTDYGSNAAEIQAQPITWKFTDSTYIMQINVYWECDSLVGETCVDSSEGWDVGFSICRVDGRYVVLDRLVLAESHSLPDELAGFSACDKKNNPSGSFNLIKSATSDTVKLTQYDTQNLIFKEIAIVKVSDL